MTTSAALEAHRRTNGQFGEQPKADAGQLDLGQATSDDLIAEFGSAWQALEAVKERPGADSLDPEVREELENRAGFRGAPFEVEIQPYMHVHNGSEPAGRPVKIDVSKVLVALEPSLREELSESGGESFAGDWVVLEAQRLGLYTEPGDHHALEVDQDELQEWFPENAPWVQDGVTPHPTGGYVRHKQTTNPDGSVDERFEDVNGRSHREDGPAVSLRFRDGKAPFEYYLRHGLYHREDGPACITPRERQWWIDGRQIASQKAWAEGWEIVDGKPVRQQD